jgi:hypothetical protein
MIKIDRTYTITLLDSNVINYTITSNNSCITINKASGSFNGTTEKIYVTYYITDLDCFIGNTITVLVTNDKGCSNTITDTLVNECNSLDVSIEQPDANNLSFNAIVTGGKPPYLFNWVYGLPNQFSSNEPNTGFHKQNQLSLSWNHNPAGILPVGYKNPQGIKVIVKDANGCINDVTNYYTLTCEPFVESQSIAAQCFPLNDGNVRKFIITLTNSGCGNLNNNPLLITYANATRISLGNNSYEITIPEFSTTSVVLPITVTNDKNVPSNTFNVTVTKLGTCTIKPDCATGFIINDNYINNSKTVTFDNSASFLTQEIDFLTDYIDYNTFTFVPIAGQTLANNILTITNKGIATFNIATKTITYTPSAIVEGTISITWKVKNECDIYSNEYTLNINSVSSIKPVVSNITKTVFLGDTSITAVTGNTTISKFELIFTPTIGTVSTNTSNVTYIPTSYSATNQVLTLKPVNQYGKVGDIFTITYTILSPGVANPLDTCSALTSYSLFNLLRANSYTTGGTWTTTSGLSITSNQVTIVNPGVYDFTYTVTNPVDSSTKSVITSINYISLSISNVDVTYDTSNTRKVKIETVGFTSSQLSLIRYVNVNVISPVGTLTRTNNVLDSIIGNFLFTTIDLTNEDGTVKTDYTSIQAIIPSELNACTNSITGTYNKTPKLLSSTLTASVTVAATITKILEVVVSLTSTLTASVTINNPQIYVSVNRFTFDADYLMIQYEFTDGQDLDTRTRMVTPDIGQDTTGEYLGYNANACFSTGSNFLTNGIFPVGSSFTNPSTYILKHGCDNRGLGFESVLINLINFKSSVINPTHYNASEITIDCRGWWYTLAGTNPVKLNVTLWKGGTIIQPTFPENNIEQPTDYTFTNNITPNSNNTLIIKSSGSVVPGAASGGNVPLNNNAHRIGVIKYNLITGVGTIDNADTTTPCIGSC